MPLQLAAMRSLPIISCFGVLWAATSGLHESQSHSFSPGAAHGGAEDSIYNKFPGIEELGGWYCLHTVTAGAVNRAAPASVPLLCPQLCPGLAGEHGQVSGLW